MKNRHNNRMSSPPLPFRSLLAALTLSSALVAPAFANDGLTQEQQQVVKLISATYDQPHHKVETAPVIVVNDYAIADWIQGERGGRALLRRDGDKWMVLACGGDEFKKVDLLHKAGIPQDTASQLISELTEAEQSIAPQKLAQFGLFGTPNNPGMSAHHQNHPQN
ncbi:copper uptake system-associated protein [Hahella sp. HN01]|uniref:copper uptake system-associated protein n=1 Tax=Hahella sp. HN01 TaxID=2847262 RepID=UPI001C1EC21D|nr:copper uptake system-associated protein [Hahella sp. HN01]MBU6954442.1 copper uptake system-associated protein [Hahella sp. HN01]